MSDPARNERHRRSVRESGETVALELQDALVRYAIGLGLTPQDAEDAVQSAFRQLYSTRPDLDSAEAWQKTVIESRSVDRARRERTAEKYRDTEKGAAPRTPVVPDLDTGIWVRTALAGLPERMRRLLVLRYWQGASDAETAARMGYRVGSVRTMVGRALARLRRDLGPDCRPARDPRAGG